ncbi:hypothetical protein TWF730_006955 [Orbilia blumenaviensis]|uniref:Sec39 domain-containing protein n=1 Tax=Orbilia blumenaviensis TaxID=1796055 RepID=A0AAV9VG54_9PEZI
MEEPASRLSPPPPPQEPQEPPKQPSKADPKTLTPSQSLLLSLHFASQCDYNSLRKLIAAQPAVFTANIVAEVVLRFVPESASVAGYVPLVLEVLRGGMVLLPIGGDEDGDGGMVDVGFVEGVGEVSAKVTLEGVGFPNHHNHHSSFQDGDIGVEGFVKARAGTIDRETGDLGLVRELVHAVLYNGGDEGGVVKAWGDGILGVVERLVGSSSSGGDVGFGLEGFEKLAVEEGVVIVLDRMAAVGDVVGGLGIVGEYIEYKLMVDKKLKAEVVWGYVFAWIARQGVGVLCVVVKGWEGPSGGDKLMELYYKMVITGCYSCNTGGNEEVVRWMLEIVNTVSERVEVELDWVEGEEVERFVEEYMTSTAGNTGHDWDVIMGELVVPTAPSLKLLEQLITSVREFMAFPLGVTVKEAMRMRFWGSKGDQLGLLRRALSVSNPTGGKGKSDIWYKGVRGACGYLRDTSRVLGRLGVEEVEVEVLRDMLAAGRFNAVTTTYVTPRGGSLLPSEVVEKAVIHAVGDFYDNATNGNRTRGGMKSASAALAILFPTHSSSPPLRRLSKLLEATHSLSEYSLTLTPGVPLKPVQIRLFPDPVGLISRVLQSNPKAYLQLDSLVKVALNLVYGVYKPRGDEEKGGGEPTEEETAAVRRRVVGMCVEAALAEDDFETAFSFVVNKLVPGYQKLRTNTTTSPHKFTGNNNADTAWQAALQTGRYRSPTMLAESMEGVATAKGIEQVMKRMEVLSQALVICPGEAVMDVLRTWKSCEDELEQLLELEIQEERQHAGKLGEWVGSTIDISRRAASGGGLLKAPMSLLGAGGRMVKGLGSTAFPLRSVSVSSRQSEEGSQRGSGEFDRGGWTVGEDGERVRKRDVLSGMVTSGLASGLGWMLGAKAEDMNQQR